MYDTNFANARFAFANFAFASKNMGTRKAARMADPGGRILQCGNQFDAG
jgi:hypothetical protein